jgi:hypothetical protein
MARSLPLPILALLAGCLLAGCNERPRAWEVPSDGGDAPVVLDASASLVPFGADAEADLEVGAQDDAGPASPDEPATPLRVGGPWVRCFGNFRISGAPVQDVTRLSLLCGPENGMVRLSRKPFEGAVTEGRPPSSTTFPALRGECYRVFAVAEPTVTDLDVTVRSSRGAAVAADHGEDAWPIVQPDRPFCALEDDTFSVEISARRGAGSFAAEVWRLRAPKQRRPR